VGTNNRMRTPTKAEATRIDVLSEKVMDMYEKMDDEIEDDELSPLLGVAVIDKLIQGFDKKEAQKLVDAMQLAVQKMED